MRTPALAALAVAVVLVLAAAVRPHDRVAAAPERAPGGEPRTTPGGELPLALDDEPGPDFGAAPAQEAGPALARELGCAACHTGVGSAELIRARAPRLGPAGDPLDAEFVFAYLADPVARRDDIGASRMPDFRLDEAERLALTLHLTSTGADQGEVGAARRRHPEVTAETGARIWDALGCAGCHGATRVGASPPDPVPGRPGPDLSREGARVLPEWLAGYLAEPGPIRSPGHPASPGSRMPDFRLTPAEAGALATWLGTLGRPTEGPPPPLTPHQSGRTARALQDRVACLGCHEVAGRGGGIGPSLSAAAARLRPGFVAEMILDPSTAAPGSLMPHQPMPDREARRLARLILDRSEGGWEEGAVRSLADPDHPAWVARGVAGARAAAGPAPSGGVPRPPGTPDGRTLYARHCAACHGPEGGGDGWNARSLPVPPTAHADAALMTLRPDDTLYDGIHGGAWVLDGSPRMPPFGGLLTAPQIRALVAYVRTLCACTEPTWAGDGR